jgi:hypothetical protein
MPTRLTVRIVDAGLPEVVGLVAFCGNYDTHARTLRFHDAAWTPRRGRGLLAAAADDLRESHALLRSDGVAPAPRSLSR